MLTSHHTQNESTQEEERQGDDRFTQLHQVLPPEVLTLSGVFPVAPNIHLTPFAEAQREERLRLLGDLGILTILRSSDRHRFLGLNKYMQIVIINVAS